MVSEEGFKPFDVISVVDKSIDHKKLLLILFLTITLTVFDINYS